MSRTARTCLGLSSLLAIAACATSPDLATSPDRHVAKDVHASTGANPVVQSATGHYEFTGRSGNINKFSFSALVHLDGTVSGEVQYQRFGEGVNDIIAHGDVICAGIVGNTARIAAYGQQTTNGVTGPGGYGYWLVIDNGEGANDPPDIGSQLGGTASRQRALDHCSGVAPFTVPVFPIERGNVQVRSSTVSE
ncbi:MAG TPA: hypothetical protein VFD67_03965 [Gemmatimonadaceae bacterium]|nr:hypothetical protein [Gemmatimonadaceae bacterium]